MPLFGSPDVARLAARGKAKTLAKLATSGDRHPGELRAEAAEALGRLDDPIVVAALVEALGDDAESVRRAAAEGLARAGDARATSALMRVLADPVSSVRSDAAAALGAIGDPAAASALVSAASTESDDWTRQCMIGALVRLGDERFAAPLLEILARVGRFGVGDVAESATEGLGRSPSLADVAALHDLSMGRSPSASTDPDLVRLVAEDPLVASGAKTAALETLRRLPDGRGTERLAELLRSPDSACRAATARLLRQQRWRPGTALDRAAWWLATGEPQRLAELVPDEITPLLVAAITWPEDDLDWLSRGLVAVQLLATGSGLDDEHRDRSRTAADELASQLQRCLDDLFAHGAKLSTQAARARFSDYADLVIDASAGHGTRAVADLGGIDTPVSTNLLHHIARMADLTVSRTVDVPYDLDHPTGEERISDHFSCQPQREMARRILSSRGDPPYDPTVYTRPGCWDLADPSSGHR